MSESTKCEVVLGLVGAVGTDLSSVSKIFQAKLKNFGYRATEVRVSRDVIPAIVTIPKSKTTNECQRLNALMDAGNHARESSDDKAILALGIADQISQCRNDDNAPNAPRAYIVRSLKNPNEVQMLRGIYGEGFYLVGVFSDVKARKTNLRRKIRRADDINALIARDEDENLNYGQKTRDTFHLADFFLHADQNKAALDEQAARCLDLIFGNPFITPMFDEYAMFLAFSTALRSADLSRQVGAVIAKNSDVLSTGANDCPAFGGGLYWPIKEHRTGKISDFEKGRDFKRGIDSNSFVKRKIVDDIIHQIGDLIDTPKLDSARSRTENSLVKDITEYGRVVHAEMECILSCARRGISCQDGTIYSTTYPCHNCAKHIIAAGIKRVVFVEPYPKSKALEFHDEAIVHSFLHDATSDSKVCFEPFIGVGPRRFFDLFSLKLGSGYNLERKSSDGTIIDWKRKLATPRLGLNRLNYIEREEIAVIEFRDRIKGDKNG